jgi:nucleoside-diphosphate-sugar epimerase
MLPWLLLSAGLAVCGSASWPAHAHAVAETRTILVTGATGRTGSIIYKQLAATPGVRVRAFVTSREDAKAKLNCTACDASEVSTPLTHLRVSGRAAVVMCQHQKQWQWQ